MALGANLGDRAGSIAAALARLCAGPEIRLVRASALYETPPWGDPDQPAYLNAAALVATALPPEGLLARCLAVEAALGRSRDTARRWGPRLIDLDVLFYDAVTLDRPGLVLPHPRMMQRAFVLVPLAEIDPDRLIAGRRVAAAAAAADATGVTRLPDPPQPA